MRVLSSSPSSSAVVLVVRIVNDCSRRYYYGPVSFRGLSYSSSICCSTGTTGTGTSTSSDFYQTTRNSSRYRNSGSFIVVPVQPPPHQLLYQRHCNLSSIAKTRVNHTFSKNNHQGSLRSFSSTSSPSTSSDEYNTSSYHYDIHDKQLAKHDLLYCMNLVKEWDYENGYIRGLLIPVHTQMSYFALRPWNVEMASIKGSSAIRYHQRRRHNTDDDNDNNNSFSFKMLFIV